MEVLGHALSNLPRSEIVVATKVGRYFPDVHDFTSERVTSSVHESMKRLHVDYLDVVQCHDIEFVDMDKVKKSIQTTYAQLISKHFQPYNVGIFCVHVCLHFCDTNSKTYAEL